MINLLFKVISFVSPLFFWVKYFNSKKSNRSLDAAVVSFVARELGIQLEVREENMKGHTYGYFTPANRNTIFINKNWDTFANMYGDDSFNHPANRICLLLHEARHAWQYKVGFEFDHSDYSTAPQEIDANRWSFEVLLRCCQEILSPEELATLEDCTLLFTANHYAETYGFSFDIQSLYKGESLYQL